MSASIVLMVSQYWISWWLAVVMQKLLPGVILTAIRHSIWCQATTQISKTFYVAFSTSIPGFCYLGIEISICGIVLRSDEIHSGITHLCIQRAKIDLVIYYYAFANCGDICLTDWLLGNGVVILISHKSISKLFPEKFLLFTVPSLYKSTLVQVMIWCCLATSHHLIQSWPRFKFKFFIAIHMNIIHRELSTRITRIRWDLR